MDLNEFLEKNEVLYGRDLIEPDDVPGIENQIGVSFGKELSQYVLHHGYLAYKHIELYGINSKQMADSDMVKQTLYLHKYFPLTKGYIALENTGDGNYIMVSSDDDVFEFYSDDNQMQNMGMKLFSYIISRFQSAEK